MVLFERTTFLVIAWSGDPEDSDEVPDDSHQFDGPVESPGPDGMHPQRFEKISELIKAFKLSCACVSRFSPNFSATRSSFCPPVYSGLREQFQSLEIRFPTYTALLEILTVNTYVMIIVADPDVRKYCLPVHSQLTLTKFYDPESAALKLNVRLARERFEQLQVGSL